MKRQIIFMLALVPMLLCASVIDELRDNPRKSGSYMYAYPIPGDIKPPALTPAPKGYVPFYIDHYGRHGSRWLISQSDYDRPVEMLERLDSAGALTARGKTVLTQIRQWRIASTDRLGELTDVGAEQHQGIARRMTENFPQIFSGEGKTVAARSSIAVRCVLSMLNEVMVLQAVNPRLNVVTDASRADMKTLANSEQFNDKLRPLQKAAREASPMGRYRADEGRFSCQLMDTARQVLTASERRSLMGALWNLGVSLQNHHQAHFDLLDLFTADDLYNLWASNNVRNYITYANAPQTRHMSPYQQCFLLRDLIAAADAALADSHRAADLRFGHDTVLMPLAVLMELDNLAVSIDDLTQVPELWHNFEVFPMAGNIQMVFYRPTKGGAGDDVLVKVLLNEHEASLPVRSAGVAQPYCRWTDLKAYYQAKLARMDAEYDNL